MSHHLGGVPRQQELGFIQDLLAPCIGRTAPATYRAACNKKFVKLYGVVLCNILQQIYEL